MTAALLSIGTEITRGELIDTNSAWIAEQLTDRGYEVTEKATVDDDPERISDTLRRLADRHDFIVSTGGLGPTTDDITASSVALLLLVPLVRDPASLEALRQRFAARGRPLSPSNEKQADFPEGATVLPNDRGTAPGFSVEIGRCRAFFLPGVPHEMRAMFEASVLPLLPSAGVHVVGARLRTFGLPESEVNDRLQGLEAEHQVTFGYRATFPEIEVKAVARRASKKDASAAVEGALTAISERLGPKYVYGRERDSLAGVLGSTLLERNVTFGVAESCTGGLVSELMTAVPGASAYYAGGVCSYANHVKEQLLGVPARTLREHGAVSEATARAMAEGARTALGVDVALSLTGIAGPGGGSDEKPVGLVHWAVATSGGTRAFQRVFFGQRWQVQRLAAFAGLATVRWALLGLDEE